MLRKRKERGKVEERRKGKPTRKRLLKTRKLERRRARGRNENAEPFVQPFAVVKIERLYLSSILLSEELCEREASSLSRMLREKHDL